MPTQFAPHYSSVVLCNRSGSHCQLFLICVWSAIVDHKVHGSQERHISPHEALVICIACSNFAIMQWIPQILLHELALNPLTARHSP
ncbi:hypothetical protein AB1N83_007115 [Pleurotus pulmonarius]